MSIIFVLLMTCQGSKEPIKIGCHEQVRACYEKLSLKDKKDLKVAKKNCGYKK